MGFKSKNLIVHNKEVPSQEGTPPIPPPPSPKGVELNKMETELLLHTIKNSNFRGEMVEIVYTLVSKLQNNLKNIE